jgi:prophage antirepressor-like protein
MKETDIVKKSSEQPSSAVFFGDVGIRRMWHQEQWYYSVVDVVGVLTESENSRRYWSDLKVKISEESDSNTNQLYEIIVQLKLPSSDGKTYLTDCVNAEGLLRIIQSIPSKKAEPFKRWLAKVGHERLQEMSDPAMAIDRARDYWKKHGRSEEWIQRRMMGQETRNKLTDYWSSHDVEKGHEFATLTNIIHEEWSGLSVKEHKNLKGLRTQNLRDHMTEEELIFTALAELSTRRIAETEKAIGMPANMKAAKQGGAISKKARVELEERTGNKVVSDLNFLKKKELSSN